MRTSNNRRQALIDFLAPQRLLLLAAIVLYVAIFSALAFDLHSGLRTHKADLGQIDQAVWNSSRGRFLEQTDNGFVASRLTDHVEPILVLVSPLLWLWNDARALLLLQVLFVAAGAGFVYAIALQQFDRQLAPRARRHIWQMEPHRRLTQPLALALAFAYLLNTQLQSALLTEFHAAPLAVPLILWALWAVEAHRWKQFAAAALLTAAVKEEIALLAAGLGVWAMWRGWWLVRQEREWNDESLQRQPSPKEPLLIGGIVALLSLGWFAIATFVIVPHYAVQVYGVAESGYFARYGALGDSPLDIVKSLFTQPQLVWQILSEPVRLHYLWSLLAGFGLLPLLAPEVLLLCLPVLMANVLSAYPAQYYGEFHYSAPLIPYMAVAAAIGMERLWGWLSRRSSGASPSFQYMPAASAGTMALAAFARNPSTAIRPTLVAGIVIWLLGWSCIVYVQDGRGPLGGRADPTLVSEHAKLLPRFIDQIPADASLTATAALHPHVSHRQYVYQFPLGLDAPVAAQWALLDVTTNTDMAPGDLKAQVDAMLAADWGVVDGDDGFLLLRKGDPDKVIPDSFNSFARRDSPDNAPLASQPRISIEDWPRWRQTRLIAEWQVNTVGDGPPEPQLQAVSPTGDVVYTLGAATPPALLWWPAQRWRAGETVRVTTLPVYLPRSAAIYTGTVAGQPLAIYRRLRDDRLVELPVDAAQQADLAASLQPGIDGKLQETSAAFVLDNGEQVQVRALLEERDYWPGDAVDLWLQWRGGEWPANLTPFVHLRRDGVNIAQQDGAPRFFADQDSAALLAVQGFVNDWRILAIPPDVALDGDWQVVAGLYDAQSGVRRPLVGGQGDEFVVGTVRLTPHIPDQSCALIPQTCASQPE